MAQHGAGRAWPYLDDAPEQTAMALGPGAGRALVGELDLLGEGERRTRRRRRRGKAATALLSSAGSSWVCAHEQAAAEREEQAQGMALPARLRARPHTELCAQQTLHGVGQQLPCGHLLNRKGLLLFCSQSQRCVATGVHFPSSRRGLHRTDKVTFLFFLFSIFFFSFLKQPASEAFF